jgi:hypothetical protein
MNGEENQHIHRVYIFFRNMVYEHFEETQHKKKKYSFLLTV